MKQSNRRTGLFRAAVPCFASAAIVSVAVGGAYAKLPPPSPDEQAKAEETAAKKAWSDKQDLYKLCEAQDKLAREYRSSKKSAGETVAAAVATPPCNNPGSYVSPVTTAAEKPRESSVAHSPTGNAAAPPSTATPHAETERARKQ
jgi:hypothetical protein